MKITVAQIEAGMEILLIEIEQAMGDFGEKDLIEKFGRAKGRVIHNLLGRVQNINARAVEAVR